MVGLVIAGEGEKNSVTSFNNLGPLRIGGWSDNLRVLIALLVKPGGFNEVVALLGADGIGQFLLELDEKGLTADGLISGKRGGVTGLRPQGGGSEDSDQTEDLECGFNHGI